MQLIDEFFPVEAISEACAHEKSVRQGHISTLQLWWARRPLAVCRAAIFAALAPSLDQIKESSIALDILRKWQPNKEVRDALGSFIGVLAEWKSASNNELLKDARAILMIGRSSTPSVLDTFAGGGSIPIEAARLGLDSFASELNPVAFAALTLALSELPQSGEKLSQYLDIANRIAIELDAESDEPISEACCYAVHRRSLRVAWSTRRPSSTSLSISEGAEAECRQWAQSGAQSVK